jgi:hypothetical protein
MTRTNGVLGLLLTLPIASVALISSDVSAGACFSALDCSNSQSGANSTLVIVTNSGTGASDDAIHGISSASTAIGVYGANSGAGTGVYGENSSTGVGAWGNVSGSTGEPVGVEGSSSGSSVTGVYGTNTFSGSGVGGTGVYGSSTQGIGVAAYGTPGIKAQSNSTTGCGAVALSDGSSTSHCGLTETGTSSFDGNITLTGSGTYTGTWSQSSDRRLKTEIAPIADALTQALRLRGVTFGWVDPARQGDQSSKQTGLIAQEVEHVFPEWVTTDRDGYKAVTTQGFPGLAVEAIRLLHDRNRQLRTRLGRAQERLTRIESSLELAKASVVESLVGLESPLVALSAFFLGFRLRRRLAR